MATAKESLSQGLSVYFSKDLRKQVIKLTGLLLCTPQIFHPPLISLSYNLHS